MPPKQYNTDKSFKCYCCKRTVLYEAKYQCVVCPDNQICKLCYKGGYHDQHQFVLRTAPDKDWEPAFREAKLPMMNEEEAKKMQEEVIRKLEEKNISTEDYQMLLNLQN